MKEKEEAKRLIELFTTFERDERWKDDINESEGKRLALICVEEKIKELDSIAELANSDYEYYIRNVIDCRIIELEEVKKQIENYEQ